VTAFLRTTAGVPRQTAKQIIGHKTDAMYNRYRIVNEQDIREGLLQVEHYLSSEKVGHQTDRKAEKVNHSNSLIS